MAEDWLIALSAVVEHIRVLARSDAVLAARLEELARSLAQVDVTAGKTTAASPSNGPAGPINASPVTASPYHPVDSREGDYGIVDFEVAAWSGLDVEPPAAKLKPGGDSRWETSTDTENRSASQSEPPIIIEPDSAVGPPAPFLKVVAPEEGPSVSAGLSGEEDESRAIQLDPDVTVVVTRAEPVGETGEDDADETGPRETIHDLTAKLTFARPSTGGVTIPKRWAGRGDVDTDSLRFVEARCRLKAEALRWCADRAEGHQKGKGLSGEEMAGQVRRLQELQAEARKLPKCVLWMLEGPFDPRRDPHLFHNAADWFEALAETIPVILALLAKSTTGGSLERAIGFLAEAQSGVRTTVRLVSRNEDPDQLTVFQWLRGYAGSAGILIPRFMRAADTPRVDGACPFVSRLDQFTGAEPLLSSSKKKEKKLFGKLEFERNRLLSDPAIASDLWSEKLSPTVAELLASGVPPSDRRFRAFLLGIEDTIPAAVAESLPIRRLLVELEKYIASRDAAAGPSSPENSASADVVACRQMLAGRVVVLIGGDVREPHRSRIETGLGLKGLDWIETSETHQAVADFESHIVRPDVALVLLGIRWSRHAYGGVRTLCAKHGKPLVWIPGGYNINQIAWRILDQCSDRLGDGAA